MNLNDVMSNHVITSILYDMASDVRVNGESIDRERFYTHSPLLICHLMLSMEKRFPSILNIPVIKKWRDSQPTYSRTVDGLDYNICDIDALPAPHKLVVILLIQNMLGTLLQPDNSINISAETLASTAQIEDGTILGREGAQLNNVIKGMISPSV